MSFVMIVELLIVLAALYVGSRYGSLALQHFLMGNGSIMFLLQ